VVIGGFEVLAFFEFEVVSLFETSLSGCAPDGAAAFSSILFEKLSLLGLTATAFLSMTTGGSDCEVSLATRWFRSNPRCANTAMVSSKIVHA
jgi:hypothetical protein